MTFGKPRVFKTNSGSGDTLDRLSARWQAGLRGEIEIKTSPTFEEARDRMLKREEVRVG